MKLKDTKPDIIHEDTDGMAMFGIFTLLSGGATPCDLTVVDRKVI